MKIQGENGYLQVKEFLRPPETRREAGGRAFPSTIRMCTHFYTQDEARKWWLFSWQNSRFYRNISKENVRKCCID